MNATSLPDTTAPRAASWTDRLLRNRLLATLGDLRDGQLQLHEAAGITTLGNASGADALQLQLRVTDPGFYRQAALNGSVGAGKSYMDGQWQCDDLAGLMRLLLRNRDRLDAMKTGTARLGGWAMRSLHTFARNTRSCSRRNIAAHYDLGNPLFSLFLDENLMYSSAIFVDGEEAQGERHWSAPPPASSNASARNCGSARSTMWWKSVPAGVDSPCMPRASTAAASPPPPSRANSSIWQPNASLQPV